MFNTILVTTDLSPFSHSAIAVARELGTAVGANIVLLHVLESQEFFMPTPDGYIPADLIQKSEEQAFSHATEELERLCAEKLSGHPVECVVEKSQGVSVYEKINSYAKEHSIELTILSTHGRSGLERLVVGSVAERVSRRSPCPVMLIPPST